MSLWTRLFGPKVTPEDLARAVENAGAHMRELDKLQQQNHQLQTTLEFWKLRAEVQTSAVECKGCAGLREAIVVLKDTITQKDATIREREHTLQQFHGAGFDRAMAETETEIMRQKVMRNEIETSGAHQPADEADERGAHAGQVDFAEPTGPKASPAMDDVLETY